MTAEPGEPTPSLADRVDDAMAAFWQGDATDLHRLVAEGGPCTAEEHVLFGGLQGPRAVPGLVLDEGCTFAGLRIQREIGRGGMGVVYAAEQQRPRRAVALKLLRGGFVSRKMLRRFEHEAELLGRLQHPGIARVFDAGTTRSGGAPQPYLVMELVVGRRLNEYCRDRRLGRRRRLELFCKVCDAVQHAHQRGVIHRDLKPANILVAEDGAGAAPQPKVLDFGVARATGADAEAMTTRTGAGQLVGTLPYMSPEQVLGDPREVDTRSDVYALGVVLCELLTGKLPHDLGRCALPEVARRIRDDPPRRLGSMDRSLRGDVETIVGKALEKDRARRYQSAAELADDIRRHLDGRPIDARRDAIVPLLRRSLRRYRGALTVGILVLSALTALTVYATVQAGRGRRLAALEREQAGRAAAVSSFLQGMLAGADRRGAYGGDVTVRHVLDDASRRLAVGSLGDLAEVEAEVRETIAGTYVDLGLIHSALPHFVWLHAHRERFHGARSQDALEALCWVAEAYKEAGLGDRSIESFRRCLDLSREALGSEHLLTLRAMDGLGNALMRMGRADEAEGLHREALQGFSRLGDEAGELLLTSTFNLGGVYRDQGHLEEAEPLYLRALELSRQLNGEAAVGTVRIRWQLARDIHRATGRLAEAEELLRTTLAQARAGLGREHTETIMVLIQLGRLLGARGEAGEAESMLRAAVDEFSQIRAVENRDTLWVVGELARLLRARGDHQQAVTVLAAGIAEARRLHGDQHLPLASQLGQLAEMHASAGDYVSARDAAGEALAIREGILGLEHEIVARSLHQLGVLQGLSRDLVEAVTLLRRALDLQRRQLGDTHRATLYTALVLARILWLDHQPANARTLLLETGALLRTARGRDAPEVQWFEPLRAELLVDVGDSEGARGLVEEMLTVARQRFGSGSPEARCWLRLHAYVLHATGDPAGAAQVWREALSGDAGQGTTSVDAAFATARLAEALIELGEPEEAEVLARTAYEALRESEGPRGIRTLWSLRAWGMALVGVGRAAEGEERLRECVARLEETALPLEWGHARASARSALGRCLVAMGRCAEGRLLMSKAYESLRAAYGDAFVETRLALERLAAGSEACGEAPLEAELRPRPSGGAAPPKVER